MDKESLIKQMTEDGYVYAGENEWYIMFDRIKDGEHVWSKDWVKSVGGFVQYNPNQKITLKASNER